MSIGCVYWMCVFCNVSLSALLRVLGEYSEYMFNISTMIIDEHN